MSVEATTKTSVRAESLKENWKKWKMRQKVSVQQSAAKTE